MSSLHTSYRPETFDDVLGQDTVVKSLKRVVKDKRAQTFLFCGPPGTGKTTLARILARELTGIGVANLIEHDGTTKSGKEDIQALMAQLQYKAIGGSPIKFVILDEVHKLSAAAWTVLLKPTEEPPPHVFYAFCTTEIGKVPKAIITRFLRYDLKPVKEELILELLIRVVDAEKFQIDDEIIEAIAEACAGSPRQALVFLEACLSCKSIGEARAILRALKYIKPLAEQEAESTRIVLQNYFAAVLLNTKSDKTVPHLLSLIEAFSTPYATSDKLAPLLLSVGIALRLDS